jgi:manganese/zinc/iron transport system ATP- binding protein
MEDEITVRSLTVNYDKKPVLWDINLDIPRGSLVGIIGPNGAGKSTLMKAMIGLLPPLSGEVRFFGKSFASHRKEIAYIAQKNAIDWDFPITVFEVILMGAYGRLGLCKRAGKKEKEEALQVLEKIGMRELADRQISSLSGGQQQRLFVGRALLQDADVFFLDEPFVGIDMATEKFLIEMFKELTRKGKTIFVVHHDLNTVEAYFDWVILLNMRLVSSGPTANVFHGVNLMHAYGQKGQILEEALEMTRMKREGALHDV